MKGATTGDGICMAKIGYFYLLGDILTKNLPSTIEWLAKAADLEVKFIAYTK
jgi:TPR repeat protein